MAVQRNNKVSVVVVCDDHYMPMLAALVKSIEANLDIKCLLDLWVVADRVTNRHRQWLENSVDTNITGINWINGREVIPQGWRLPLDKSSFPLNIYLWYFMPFFLPMELERVLYLDVDMINCRDLSELWYADIGNKIVGGVVDPRIRTFECEWGGILNYEELGLSGNLPYLNTGVMLVNLNSWRKNRVTERALQVVSQFPESAVYPEQYGINIALVNQWAEINPLWNYFATATLNNTPYNIHFVDRKPIYRTYQNNPSFRQQFVLYLQKTAWGYLQPMSELKRICKKLKNVLEKYIRPPFPVTRKRINLS